MNRHSHTQPTGGILDAVPGFTQTDLAELLCTSRVTLLKYRRRADRPLPAHVRLRLAAAIGARATRLQEIQRHLIEVDS